MKTLSQVEPRTPISSLPFTITSPGAYYLTTNLTGVSGQNGISVNASYVTIDLRGFAIVGVSGSINGITAAVPVTNLVVQNGSLSGWGQNGINGFLASFDQYTDLFLSGNGGSGLFTGTGDQISRCNASQNAVAGFNGYPGCAYESCTANQNLQYGFSTDRNSRFAGCIANNNTLYGFYPYTNCILNDCTAVQNGQGGIVSPYIGCTAVNCVANFNGGNGLSLGDNCVARGCTGTSNSSNGILTGNNSVINSCTASVNGSTGITAENNTTVESSTASANKGQGINAGNGCTLTSCNANSNQLGNILTSTGCTLSQCTANASITGNGFSMGPANNLLFCTATYNGSNGFDTTSGRASLTGCNASFNGNAGIHVEFLAHIQQCTANNNGIYGILCDANGYATIMNNNCSFNGGTNFSFAPAKGAGIYITNSPGCRIEANTLNINYIGLLVATNNNALVIRNSVNSSYSTPYLLGTGNSWGPIVNVSGVGDISGTANANNPQANFIH